jgi:hypothetical protein
VTIVVQSSRSRLKAFVADLGVAALTTMSHENSSIMTSRTGQGGPPVGGVPAISDDRLVIVVVVPKQKKDQKALGWMRVVDRGVRALASKKTRNMSQMGGCAVVQYEPGFGAKGSA